MGEDLGTSVKGENPAALPGKVLPAPDPDGSRKMYSERRKYFDYERDRPPWGAAPTAEPGRWFKKGI